MPRITGGAVLALVAFLFVAPLVFFVVPLTVLLLLSGPRTAREWLWVALGAIWTLGLWLRPAPVTVQLVNAWGVVITGLFVLLAFGRPGPAGRAALFASTMAAAAFVLLLPAWGLTLRTFELEVMQDAWTITRVSPDLVLTPSVREFLGQMADSFSAVATTMPAQLFLSGALGLGMAWQWYQRLASRPVGAPIGAFERFRFSDQVVWALVLGVALVLGQQVGAVPAGSAPLNLIVVLGGLYAARGLAILWPAVKGLPVVLRVVWALVSLMLGWYAVPGLFGIGLADTWIDFRRPAAPAQGD